MVKRVIVVGGGAAGLMAAGRAAQSGAKVVLMEKNNKLGKKLAITGKGRCNVTNDTDVAGLIQNMPGNGRFLYSAFSVFDSYALRTFLEEWQVPTKVERGLRVFPKSDRASDVIAGFKRFINHYQVEVRLNHQVDSITTKQNKISGVIVNGKEVAADAVIIATGGVSYPATGSTGDGYAFARKTGHEIVKVRPSLVPLETRESWPCELQGLTLKNVEVSLCQQDKVLQKVFGELLFTHFGVSGPVVLTLSRQVDATSSSAYNLKIDLKPALTAEKLDQRLLRDFKKYSRKQFKNGLTDLLPKRLIPIVITLTKIDPEKPINQLQKEERKHIVDILKGLPLTISRPRPLSEAIITVGGVATLNVQASTMASKLIAGLYFAGEVLDIDGYTGGFNLQAAFSTGYLAGISAAEYVLNM